MIRVEVVVVSKWKRETETARFSPVRMETRSAALTERERARMAVEAALARVLENVKEDAHRGGVDDDEVGTGNFGAQAEMVSVSASLLGLKYCPVCARNVSSASKCENEEYHLEFALEVNDPLPRPVGRIRERSLRDVHRLLRHEVTRVVLRFQVLDEVLACGVGADFVDVLVEHIDLAGVRPGSLLGPGRVHHLLEEVPPLRFPWWYGYGSCLDRLPLEHVPRWCLGGCRRIVVWDHDYLVPHCRSPINLARFGRSTYSPPIHFLEYGAEGFFDCAYAE